MIFSGIKQCLNQSGLLALLRYEQPDSWQDVWNNLETQYVDYAASTIDYQHAYMKSSGENVADISMVLIHAQKPCAIWPLTLAMNECGKLGSQGSPLLPPLFINSLSAKTIKKITTNALRFVVNVQQLLSQELIESREYISPHALNTGISEWHQQWMSIGATVSVKHDLFIDLTLSMDEIRSSFRKSYRPLISSGLKLWASEIMTRSCPDADIWSEFKALHQQVAGRITRSNETWDLQYSMIVNGEALLVHLHDKTLQNRMVGAGFFQITRDEGIYAVAAYDRELFPKPLGHVVQQRAIEAMKQHGLRHYRIGERFYPSYIPKPTEKELSISLFKQGFAGLTLPRFVFSLDKDSVAT